MTSRHYPPIVNVDPAVLDSISVTESIFVTGDGTEFDPIELLCYLPDLEAEIFWLIWVRRKSQQDVAALLGMAQSSVSNRYRRCLEKMAFLVYLTALDVRGVVDRIDVLSPSERQVLVDLFFYLNQQRVGQRHGIGQSSVRWIAFKSRRYLEKQERADPEKYFNVLGLVYFLFRNLGIRIFSD